MSISFKAKEGDTTFSIIAQQTAGSDTFAAQIKRANPGIAEPIPPGTMITVPTNRENTKGFLASGLDLKIDGTRIVTISNFTLSKRIDAIRKVSFTVPNELDTRAILRPLIPSECVAGYNGQAELQGRISTPSPNNSGRSKSLVVSAHSECANLEKSAPPLSAFPLEFRDQNLEQIASTICGIMGVNVFFGFDSGARFKRVDIQHGEKVLSFLSGLAEQRNFVITDDEFGSLLFTRGDGAGAPILEIDDDQRSDVQVSVKFLDDSYYSSVTGILPTKTKKPGKQYTVENPFFNGYIRPHTYETRDIDKGELETAVNSAASRMFAGVFQATVSIAGWTDLNGEIYKTNRLVKLRSPSNYIDNWAELLIAGVTLTNDGGSEKTELDLVLPAAFSGAIPEVLPWAR